MISLAVSTALGLIAAWATWRSATLASACPGTARVLSNDSLTSGLRGMEATLLEYGREAEVTAGVRGMFTSPAAEMPNAEEAPGPLVADAGTMSAAATAGAARTPATAPYVLRMGCLS